MDKKIIELGDALMALTTAEALELQNYLESKGLKPAQPAIVAVATPVTEEIKESANVNIVLTDKGTCGSMKLIKALLPITGKPALETKKIVDEMPAIIMANIPRETAKATVSELANELGADVIFELKDCQ